MSLPAATLTRSRWCLVPESGVRQCIGAYLESDGSASDGRALGGQREAIEGCGCRGRSSADAANCQDLPLSVRVSVPASTPLLLLSRCIVFSMLAGHLLSSSSQVCWSPRPDQGPLRPGQVKHSSDWLAEDGAANLSVDEIRHPSCMEPPAGLDPRCTDFLRSLRPRPP